MIVAPMDMQVCSTAPADCLIFGAQVLQLKDPATITPTIS